jgi:hypothetical protein
MVYLQKSVLPDGSVAVHVTSWLPTSNVTVPEKSHKTVTVPLLSDPPAGINPTEALADPLTVLREREAGQTTLGAITSPMKMAKEQLALFVEVSSVIHPTIVRPRGNSEPEVTLQLVDRMATLSVAVGGVNVTADED